jgi:hypothetical protein
VNEAVEFLQKWVEDRFIQQTQLTKAIDSLGEEVASDINAFEQSFKVEGEKIIALGQQLNALVTEVKVMQAEPKREMFSENLVKQLIR